jgi:hypothetical protein
VHLSNIREATFQANATYFGRSRILYWSWGRQSCLLPPFQAAFSGDARVFVPENAG